MNSRSESLSLPDDPHTAQSTLYSLAYEIYNEQVKPEEISSKIEAIVEEYAYNIRDALQDEETNFYDWDGLSTFYTNTNCGVAGARVGENLLQPRSS